MFLLYDHTLCERIKLANYVNGQQGKVSLKGYKSITNQACIIEDD